MFWKIFFCANQKNILDQIFLKVLHENIFKTNK